MTSDEFNAKMKVIDDKREELYAKQRKLNTQEMDLWWQREKERGIHDRDT